MSALVVPTGAFLCPEKGEGVTAVIRIVVALVWIGLILATALTRQVVANWALSAGLAVYLVLRWCSRHARIASSRQPSHRRALAGQPQHSSRLPGIAEHRHHPRARWH
jgi:hypothetical protein